MRATRPPSRTRAVASASTSKSAHPTSRPAPDSSGSSDEGRPAPKRQEKGKGKALPPRKLHVNFLSFGYTARQNAGEQLPEGTMLSPHKEKFLDRCYFQAAAVDMAGAREVGEGAGAEARAGLLDYYGEVRATPEGLATQTAKVAALLPKIDLISVQIAERGQDVMLHKGFVINPVQLMMARRYLAKCQADPERAALDLHSLSYALLHWYKLPDGSLNKAGLPSTTTEPLISETYEDTFRMKNEYQKRLYFRIKALGADYEGGHNLPARGAAHEMHLSGSENEIVLASDNTYAIVDITETENRVILDYVATGKSDIGDQAIERLHNMHGFPEERDLHRRGEPIDILPDAPVVNLDDIPENELLKRQVRHHFRHSRGTILPRYTQALTQQDSALQTPPPALPSLSESPTPAVKTFWVPPPPQGWDAAQEVRPLDRVASPADVRRTRSMQQRPASVVPPTYAPTPIPSHAEIFSDPVYPLLRNIDYRGFLSASDISAGIDQLINDQRACEALANMLTADVNASLDFIRDLRAITFGITNVSSLGLQSTLRKAVVDSPHFQALMRDPMNVERLVGILVMANLPDEAQAQLLRNAGLVEAIRQPLFEDHNAFTGMRFTGRFEGMEVRRGAQAFPKLWRNNFLTDLFLNCPVHSLQTNVNGYDDQAFLNADSVGDSIDCYERIDSALRSILPIAPSDALENELRNEAYTPERWNNYIDRFFELGRICHQADYQLIDHCEQRLAPLLSLSAKDIIAQRLLMTERYSHFLLDPKHLANVLGFDYGGVRRKLNEVMIEIAEHPEVDEDHEFAGKQLFQRLKLLEFELFKEMHVNANPKFSSAAIRDDFYRATGVHPPAAQVPHAEIAHMAGSQELLGEAAMTGQPQAMESRPSTSDFYILRQDAPQESPLLYPLPGRGSGWQRPAPPPIEALIDPRLGGGQGHPHASAPPAWAAVRRRRTGEFDAPTAGSSRQAEFEAQELRRSDTEPFRPGRGQKRESEELGGPGDSAPHGYRRFKR